jgi:hypothetical protein
MEKQVNLCISKTEDNNYRFVCDDIIIIVDHYSTADDLHYITNPGTAIAYFKCNENKYSVDNTNCLTTIEEWYTEELLPKKEMMSLLLTPIA